MVRKAARKRRATPKNPVHKQLARLRRKLKKSPMARKKRPLRARRAVRRPLRRAA
jgi:hypothetical protein